VATDSIGPGASNDLIASGGTAKIGQSKPKVIRNVKFIDGIESLENRFKRPLDPPVTNV
jgi:hypothetical protein